MPNTFKSPRSQSVGTTLTQVGGYAVTTGGSATLIGATVANRTASPITCDIYLRTSGAVDTAIVVGAPVPVGGSLMFGGAMKIVMEVGDRIMVRSSAAASADVILSMLEVTP